MQNKFTVRYHHIGGRGGKFPIAIPETLRDGVDLIMYDADESCCEDAKTSHFVQGFHQVNVLPFCISDKDAFEDFIITKQPHASSLLRADPAIFPYIRNSPKFGAMRLKEILSPHKSIRVESRTLASALSCMGAATPDFISLDTQGTEFDIIKASRPVFENAMLVNAEIAFMPMYSEQKNFPEIHNLMMEMDFILVNLRLYDPHHACLTPIDFDGKGFLLDGEAFYIKSPDIAQCDFSTLLKFGFAALLCEQSHLCIIVFDALQARFSRELTNISEVPNYVRLIVQLLGEYCVAPKVVLPNFHDSKTYRGYHIASAEVAELDSCVPSLIGLDTMVASRYADILNEFGLDDFAKTVIRQQALNIETIKHVHANNI